MDELEETVFRHGREVRQVFYGRVSGLLAQAAHQGRPESDGASALIVAEGRLVRDACPLARAQGVKTDMSVRQARRLCPAVLVLPLENISCERQTTAFLDVLADLSPVVEPDAPDAAFMDMAGIAPESAVASLQQRLNALLGLPLIFGIGPSRLAARALAECRLSPDRLGQADSRWLWPEDETVTARLHRLGLVTFGHVAALPESALVYQFGRIGRLLHRRALGQDLTPVRGLYPPPRADAWRHFAEVPLENEAMFDAALAQLAAETARQLRALGRFGRRVVLRIFTEKGEARRERVPPAPLQSEAQILAEARRLRAQVRIGAPVTALRLLVEDLEMPAATTPDLFGGKARERDLALAAAQRTLAVRYGPQALTRLGRLPLSAREMRRAQLQAWWKGAP